MRRQPLRLTAVAILLFAGALPGIASASLIDRGGGLIYDTDLDITWLADANYAFTSGYDQQDFTDGLMTYAYAMAWADQLTYGGFTNWRLPTTLQPDATCANQYSFGSGQFNCTGSEMGHLFYTELGGTAFNSILGTADPDLALFTNVQSDGYWSEREFDATFAWVFNFGYGLQAADQKVLGYYAWAVRDGDVSAVPAPGAAWLLGTGLLGVIGWARRRQAAA